MSIRELLVGKVSKHARSADLALLVLRVFAGLALAFLHGLGKIPPSDGFISGVAGMGLPWPTFFAWASGAAEFGGGLLLAAGLFTRPAAVLIILNMSTAVFLAHAGDPLGGRELAIFFGVVALVYLVRGAGRFSLDALLRNRWVSKKKTR